MPDAAISPNHRRAVETYPRGSGYRWVACLAASRVVGGYTNGATLALASDLCLSVSQVENLARAGWGYRAWRRFGDISAIRRRLTPSHFAAMYDLWRRWEFAPQDAVGYLREAAAYGSSVAAMREAVGKIEQVEQDALPAWLALAARLCRSAERLAADFDGGPRHPLAGPVAEVVRAAAGLREAMEER